MSDPLKKLRDGLVKNLKKEILLQKHKATGKMLNSVRGAIVVSPSGTYVEVYAELYSKFVDSGRRTGVTRVPVFALMEWVKARGIASGEQAVKSAAFAIREKIFQEGIPTRTSKSLAARRTGMIEFTLKNSEELIQKTVNEFGVFLVVNVLTQAVHTFSKAEVK